MNGIYSYWQVQRTSSIKSIRGNTARIGDTYYINDIEQISLAKLSREKQIELGTNVDDDKIESVRNSFNICQAVSDTEQCLHHLDNYIKLVTGNPNPPYTKFG